MRGVAAMGINLGEIRERSANGYDQDTRYKSMISQRINTKDLIFQTLCFKKHLHVIWIKRMGVS